MEKYPSVNPYTYCLQNPINFTEPTGMAPEEGEGWIKNILSGEISYDANVSGSKTLQVGQVIYVRNTLAELSNNNFSEVFSISEYIKGDNLNGDGTRNSTINLENIAIGDMNSLDPSTVGHNLLGLTYPGGNNPRTFNVDYDYTYIPKDLSEYPAIGHDRRYDNLNITGASGLFLDTRAIGADWYFVKQELSIAATNPNYRTRINAFSLGVGLGFFSLPKTLYQHSNIYGLGLTETVMWFNISDKGVKNTPSKK